MKIEEIIKELNLHPNNKEDTLERIFCHSILAEGIETCSRILKRYIEVRDIVYPIIEIPLDGEVETSDLFDEERTR